jgi:transposase
MDGPRKYHVRLTAEQRERFEQLTRNGQAPAKKILHARCLLMSDQDHPAGRWHDAQIAAALGLHVNSVARVRRRFVCEGEQPALDRKPRLTPPCPPKLDGHAEAHLVALCCSDPPAGRAHWTMSLLAQALVGRGIVTSISTETVRLRLKKTGCSPGRPSGSASRSVRAAASPRGWSRSWTSTRCRTTRPSR